VISERIDLEALAARAIDAALAGASSEKLVAELLRANPMPNADRERLARWVLGVQVWRAHLRYRLERAGEPDHAAAMLEAYRRFIEQPAKEIDWPADPVERLCVEASLPAWIARLWIAELGFPSARSLALAMNTPGPVTLRANTARITREALATRLRDEGIEVAPTRLCASGLHVNGRANLWGSEAWREGLFEVQDEGSQRIAEFCGARPGERWLDLCAGSGGKTLALASAMNDQGEVVAFDVDAKKLQNLRARVARSRMTCVRVCEASPDGPLDAPAAQAFDGVLIDAPCSELGTLRRHPDARWRLTPESIAHLPALQKHLMEIGRARLRPGGRGVYATCTLRRAENEDVAGTGTTLRPDAEGTDGFFMAVWK